MLLGEQERKNPFWPAWLLKSRRLHYPISLFWPLQNIFGRLFAQHSAAEQEMKERRGCHGNNWTEGGPGPERKEEPIFLLEFKGVGCLGKEEDIGIGRNATLFFITHLPFQ